jgi:hypothetical protein
VRARGIKICGEKSIPKAKGSLAQVVVKNTK